jgi:hypothetical protein
MRLHEVAGGTCYPYGDEVRGDVWRSGEWATRLTLSDVYEPGDSQCAGPSSDLCFNQ